MPNNNGKPNNCTWKLPQILPRLLLAWYDQSARLLPWRKDTDPYHVWVSEIMLQQTGVEVVTSYYARFLESFPTIEALAAADEQRVLKLWEGLGYYTRARNLMKTAQIIVRDLGCRFPDTYEAIVKLPGVGPYTAGAVASICFNEPVPAVDGNVVRVIARLAGIYCEVTGTVKNRITASLREICPSDRPGDFTQSLMELGAVVCIPNGAPKCAVCPISGLCVAYRNNTVMSLPVTRQRPAKKNRELTVFLLSCGDHIALCRREDSGLLAGLWELPNVAGILGEQEAFALASEWDARPLTLVKAFRRRHIFTHVKWDMLCYCFKCGAKPDRFIWAAPEQVTETYPLPTAFKKFFDT